MKKMMLRRALSTKINLDRWLDAHGPTLKPPVSNKLLYGDDSALKVMVVGGPNRRRDYHLQTGEEFFMQLKGDLVLKVLEGGKLRNIVVPENSTFLLPSLVPHSPQRSENSIGIVFERSHTPDEMDGLMWFDEKGEIEYEEYFHCVDLGTQLKPIIERYERTNERTRVSDPPVKPDESVSCGIPSASLEVRGDEVLSNLHVGPKVLESSASPFDVFAWQRNGTSTYRLDDQQHLEYFQKGDVTLIRYCSLSTLCSYFHLFFRRRKGTKYEWTLEPGATMLSVANLYS